jgi:U3 small nucleolar ribonucleoprotein protein IMP4
MVVCHLPYGPTAYFGVFNTVLRHDIGQKREVGTIRWVGGDAGAVGEG